MAKKGFIPLGDRLRLATKKAGERQKPQRDAFIDKEKAKLNEAINELQRKIRTNMPNFYKNLKKQLELSAKNGDCTCSFYLSNWFDNWHWLQPDEPLTTLEKTPEIMQLRKFCEENKLEIEISKNPLFPGNPNAAEHNILAIIAW